MPLIIDIPAWNLRLEATSTMPSMFSGQLVGRAVGRGSFTIILELNYRMILNLLDEPRWLPKWVPETTREAPPEFQKGL